MSLKFYPEDQLLLPWSPRFTIGAARVAEMLDTSIWTVHKLCQEGKLEAYKLRANSSSWRINRDSVMCYIEDLHRANGLAKRF